MKLILSAALVIALMASPRVSAVPLDITMGSTHSTAAVTKTVDDPVVVKGKGLEIRRSELDQVLAAAKARHPEEEFPPDAKVHALAQLIEIQLILNKATDAEKAEGKKNAEERFVSTMKTLGAVEAERRLKAAHMTADDLHLMLSQEMTAQASLTRQLGIEVTDAEAKKYFDDHPGAFDQPAMVRVREILLLTTSDFSTSAAPPLPAATIQAKRKVMDELLKRIHAGEDFAALAKQYNEDPISKGSGGEISFKREQMEFGDLAFSMRPNQVSDVLTNQDGFRIFQLLEIIPAKQMEFGAVVGRIKNGLIGEEKRMRAPAYINQLRRDADFEILDAGLKAAVAANDAEMAANAERAAEAQAAAVVEANSRAQKEAEAKVFGAGTNQSAAKP